MASVVPRLGDVLLDLASQSVRILTSAVDRLVNVDIASTSATTNTATTSRACRRQGDTADCPFGR